MSEGSMNLIINVLLIMAHKYINQPQHKRPVTGEVNTMSSPFTSKIPAPLGWLSAVVRFYWNCSKVGMMVN